MQEGPTRPRRPTPDEQLLVSLCLSVALVLGVVPLLFVGALLFRYLHEQRSIRARRFYASAVIFGLLVTYGLRDMTHTEYSELVNALLHISEAGQGKNVSIAYGAIALLTLPLAPTVAGGFMAFSNLKRALQPYKTTDEWKEEQLKREARAEAIQQEQARTRSMELSDKVTPYQITLGTIVGGDMLPRGRASIALTKFDQWLVGEVGQGANDLNIIREHLFVIGATGSGKTTTLYRLCSEILRNCPSLDLIVIDGKGDENVATTLRALIWKYRQRMAPVVSLDEPPPGTAPTTYHGFCGGWETIYNRLAAMIKTTEATGAGEAYYADRNRDLLSLICKAPKGPPRSFADLSQRLSLSWLKTAYANVPQEHEALITLKQQRLDEIAVRLRPLARLLDHVIAPTGFRLEDTHEAIFSLDTLSNKDSASRFCEFFIEDFKNYVSRRAQRQGILLIDEFGAFGATNIRDLLAMARSRNWGVCLLTQDYANMGHQEQARQIVANCTTRLLMRTDYPEEMTLLAGTKLHVEGSIQRGPDGPTGMGSDRIQHTLKIDPNAVRKAARGKAWVYRMGYTIEVQVSPVQLTPEEIDAVAQIPVQAQEEQVQSTVTPPLEDGVLPDEQETPAPEQEPDEAPTINIVPKTDTAIPRQRRRGTFRLEE